jgi:hypothetical protein
MQLRREFSPLSLPAASPQPSAVPWSFADSIKVVAALTRAGADFVAGPTDIGVTSAIDGSGTLSWKTHYYGRTIQVADSDA